MFRPHFFQSNPANINKKLNEQINEQINEKNERNKLTKKITVDSSKPAVTRNGPRQKKSLRDFFFA